ncbi:LuxR family transcriptional regulator, partial [Nocardioides sp.]|uniref:helix-turn-helix transcriptional regulator n=1 Tax=Nocardioides sp. TaxID=35761 RepID=UPI002732D904
GEAAEGRPIVLLVDDAPLLDAVSQLLVAQLAAAGRVQLVASVRQGDPLPEPLVATWSAARDVRVDLAPLAVDATRTLLETALAGPVAHRTTVTLHAASGGNPLYLRELVIGAVTEGSLVCAADVWQLSGGPTATPALRDLVLSRISHLDPAARDAFERLAVCGELRPDQLPGAEVRAALTTLESEGLVTVSRGGVAVARPVYAAVLAQSMSRLRVEDILTEQAALLAERGGGAPDVLQVTMWQLEAGIEADREVLVAASRYAAAAGEHTAVIRLTEAGLRRGPDDGDLLLLRAEALLRTGRADEAIAAIGRHPGISATATDALAGDGARLVRLTAVALLAGHGPQAALAALDDAARSGRSAALELTRSTVLLAAGRSAEAEHTARSVAELMDDSPAAAARIALARAVPLGCLGRAGEALAAARCAVDLATASEGRAPALGRAESQLTLAAVQHLAGQYADARVAAVQALAAATESGDEVIGRSVEFMLGRIALDVGDLPAAERWLTETVSGATSVGPPGLATLARVGLAVVHALGGSPDRGLAVLAEVPHDQVASSLLTHAHAWLEGAAGDVEGAVRRIASAAAAALDGGDASLAAASWQIALELDLPDRAAPPLRRIADACDSPFLSLLAGHAEAAAAGDHTRLLELADEWESRGALRLAATAAGAAARTLRGRSATAARSRTDELVRRCGGLDTPGVRFGDPTSPLTPREREIAALAAAGATSKEIAAQLFVSSRTVDNHLQSVYTKLGVSGRQELAGR